MKIIDTSKKDWRKQMEECVRNSKEFVVEADELRLTQAIKTLKKSPSNAGTLKFVKLHADLVSSTGGHVGFHNSGIAGVAASRSRKKIMGKEFSPFELTDKKPKNEKVVDISIRHIVEKFNKSKNIKTVFSCGGHRHMIDFCQVYIQFEMDKEHVGTFLEMAFSTITFDDVPLALRLMRVVVDEWPKANRERLALMYLSMTQGYNRRWIKLARDYFHRLSLEVSARL